MDGLETGELKPISAKLELLLNLDELGKIYNPKASAPRALGKIPKRKSSTLEFIACIPTLDYNTVFVV